MFKSEKSKRLAITAGVVFVVVYAILYLIIQAGFSIDRFSSVFHTIISVCTPILAGAMIAYLLNPILRFFEKKIFKKMKRPRLRRALSVILTYILVILILIGLFSAILPQVVSSIREFGSNIDNYASALQTTISALFDDINAYIDEHPSIRNILENIGVYNWIGRIIEEDINDNPPPTDGALPPENNITIPNDETITTTQKHELSFEAFTTFLLGKLSELSAVFSEGIADLANSLIGLGFSFFNFLKNIVLGIFISIYLLLGKERVGAQCKRCVYAIFPKKSAEEILRITKKSDRTAGRFILGTLIDAVFVSIVTLILLTIFDIKYSLLIALIIGITNMIPFFGPFIGAIPSALLLLIDDITRIVNSPEEPIHFSCLTFIILILVIQQIDGNIINPRVIGNSTGLSSLGVILSVTVMSGLFGFFGMLLGVPVAAIFIGIGSEIIEKLLEKKKLPVALAEYYSKNSMVPPETPEEEQEHHEHTAFYRWMMRIHEKLRHIFRKLLYRRHGKSLKMWVKMKLGVRNVRHKVNHTIHPDQYRHEDASEQQSDNAESETQDTDTTSDQDTPNDNSGKN